jgi:hypothetical protein
VLDTLIHSYGPNVTLQEAQARYNSKQKIGYKCPKCGGKGYIVTEYNAYPSGLPDSGWVYKPGYDYQMCDLCKGDGYTLKEYKQIQAFKEKHKNCIRKNPTTIGGGFSYIFTPTGIGTAVSIKCNICNEDENCTDYDCW